MGFVRICQVTVGGRAYPANRAMVRRPSVRPRLIADAGAPNLSTVW
jgi:hypothetical protein